MGIGEPVVLAFWRRRGWLRRVVGVAAAYTFMLQMVLTGIIATQMAAAASAEPSVICFGGSPDGSHDSNGTHTSDPACAICTIAAYVPLLAEAGHTVSGAERTAAAFHPAAALFAAAGGWHNPRSSQGPPQRG